MHHKIMLGIHVILSQNPTNCLAFPRATETKGAKMASKSLVWEHFKKSDVRKSQCKICDKRLLYLGGKTSSVNFLIYVIIYLSFLF